MAALPRIRAIAEDVSLPSGPTPCSMGSVHKTKLPHGTLCQKEHVAWCGTCVRDAPMVPWAWRHCHASVPSRRTCHCRPGRLHAPSQRVIRDLLRLCILVKKGLCTLPVEHGADPDGNDTSLAMARMRGNAGWMLAVTGWMLAVTGWKEAVAGCR